ncbi:MAG: GntR family transcriptional regulator [Clostridiaceae bacterium]|nr:GntR family transcriptional regulator [Clostridiaceae bacterium]
MDFRTDMPIYLQIANHIKERIMSGALPYGEKLPSVREYSLEYEVSPLTIQRAMTELDSEGIIKSKRGVGSFVLVDCKDNLEERMVDRQIEDFIAKMRNVGLSDTAILNKVKGALEDE